MLFKVFKNSLDKGRNNFLSIEYLRQYNQKIGSYKRLKIISSLFQMGRPTLFPIMFWKRNYLSLTLSSFGIFVKHSIDAMIIFTIMKQFYDQKIIIKPSKKSEIRFKDIIGIEEFKEELEDVVEYLKNRKKYLRKGAKIPKGILLVGPPGCGKTQLARAVAGETNMPFYQFSASDFVQPEYGKGEKVIRQVFKQARKSGAIIFIDEIDSIGGRNQYFTSMNSLVNQLLTEMDGFVPSDNVLVIGATNRENELDQALKRSGRFDLKIRIRLPVKQNRRNLLQYFMDKITYDKKVNLELLSQKTIGFSPAEIKNLVNLSMVNSIKRKKYFAEEEDFSFAFEKIKLGIKGQLQSKYKKEIAMKEAAKAVYAEIHTDLPQVEKISLFQYQQNTQGKSIYVEQDDMSNYNKKELLLRIQMLMSGKVVSDMNDYSSNVNDQDLRKCLNLINRYVTVLGMEERFSLLSLQKEQFSQEVQQQIENKQYEILQQQYDIVKQKLKQNYSKIKKVQQQLLDKEQLERDEFLQLIAQLNIIKLIIYDFQYLVQKYIHLTFIYLLVFFLFQFFHLFFISKFLFFHLYLFYSFDNYQFWDEMYIPFHHFPYILHISLILIFISFLSLFLLKHNLVHEEFHVQVYQCLIYYLFCLIFYFFYLFLVQNNIFISFLSLIFIFSYLFFLNIFFLFLLLLIRNYNLIFSRQLLFFLFHFFYFSNKISNLFSFNVFIKYQKICFYISYYFSFFIISKYFNHPHLIYQAYLIYQLYQYQLIFIFYYFYQQPFLEFYHFIFIIKVLLHHFLRIFQDLRILYCYGLLSWLLISKLDIFLVFFYFFFYLIFDFDLLLSDLQIL